jgi:hypothetical protein
MVKRIYLGIICLIMPIMVIAEYTDSCALFAQMLWSASSNYDSAKSSFESACDPYIGYSKGNESACGSYGYERSSYESAKAELEDALNNVALFCGTCDGMVKLCLRKTKKESMELKSEVKELKKHIKELEKQNKVLREKHK